MTGPSGTVTPNEEKSFSWSPSSQVPHFLRNHYRTSSNGHSTPGFPSSGNNSAASSVIHLPNSNSYSSGSTSEKTEPPSSFQTVPVLGAQAGNAQSTQPSSMAGTEDIRSKQAGKQKHSLAFGFFSLLSVILAAVVIAFGWINTPQQKLCLAFEDDFSGRTTLNTDNWEYEVRTDGFGNHEFEMTTTQSNNSFIEDGKLYLVPTLTSDEIGETAITGNYTYSLNSTCTAFPQTQGACETSSNATLGTVIQPIKSARIRTKASISRGRIEVRARLPVGDWIWPAIWMMPEDSVYGEWPRSGEIDIVESKGNTVQSRKDRYQNSVTSTLHWGPSAATDRWGLTTSNFSVPRDYFSEDFHTYGLDWTPTSLTTWVDKPSRHIMTLDMNRDFFAFSRLSHLLWNGTAIQDPWNGKKGAPFDQKFYLILNVAVGGTNGYFSDAERNKPWQNAGSNPVADFWAARTRWLPSWPSDPKKRGMAIDSVKMWQRC
ncbi:concanavalin A-like lectin/glucanase [Moesziomyces antarcticus]|uniref:Related to beta-1,3-glucan binding protein n=2 Tax=Pseudozyma antarctica TaxID=84753 RepID=A0A5C3FPV4_PSEA2|nr:concanavalin A-like lectin/glucanase [Moesziomyces antarcticus]GAK65446.1 concanavalin A-like lectin/glucanase [Moesziomyces antarcticus]SPO46454.1 related to beta-1,3-glucan binding protein [Moesziomyces antarcticus]